MTASTISINYTAGAAELSLRFIQNKKKKLVGVGRHASFEREHITACVDKTVACVHLPLTDPRYCK